MSQSNTIVEHCVLAEYADVAKANVGYLVLQKDLHEPDRVSIIRHSKDLQQDLPADSIKSPDGDAMAGEKAMGMGVLIGGGVAGPIAATTLIGPFIVAGPLAGMAVGALAGGLVGMSSRWNLGEELLAKYERRLQDGGVIIAIHASETQCQTMMRLMQTTNPASLHHFELERHLTKQELSSDQTS